MEKERKPRYDIMLDIETLGNKPGCVVLSVAMKHFELNTDVPSTSIDVEYSAHINVMSSIAAGFDIDDGTVKWWQNQSEDTKAAMTLGMKLPLSVDDVAMEVYQILKDINENYELYIWGRGVSTFDMPILDEMLRRGVGMSGEEYKTPWKFWSAMEVRSIYGFHKLCGMPVDKVETRHDALADVEKQIKEVQQCYAFITQSQ